MSQMTFWSEDRPDAVFEAVMNKVIADAEQKFDKTYSASSKGLYPVGNEVGRQVLRPSHFYQASGLPMATYGDQWTTPAILTNKTAAQWFSSKTPEEVFIIIEGVFNETFKLTSVESLIHALKPTLGGTELPWMGIELLQSFREPWGYFQFPMVLSPETICKFEIMNSANIVAVADERIGLIGWAIGERNSLIDQQP